MCLIKETTFSTGESLSDVQFREVLKLLQAPCARARIALYNAWLLSSACPGDIWQGIAMLLPALSLSPPAGVN